MVGWIGDFYFFFNQFHAGGLHSINVYVLFALGRPQTPLYPFKSRNVKQEHVLEIRLTQYPINMMQFVLSSSEMA